MKKKIFLAALAAVMLCGCKEINTGNGDYNVVDTSASETNLTEQSSESAAEITVSEIQITEQNNESTDDTAVSETELSEESKDDIDEAVIRKLLDENFFCMRSIFGWGNLGYTGEPVQGDNIYRVENDIFADYAEFENYIRSIYCNDEADRLMYNYPYEDSQMYLDIDGELCIDINLAGAKGYYVDWSDCKIIINFVSEDRCEFTAIGSIEEPAEVPVKEEYPVDGAAVLENGKWVLEKAIY
ncbi:MAG: hypothetical protein ACI4KG_02845 [Oscillospiraceae bacterium]